MNEVVVEVAGGNVVAVYSNDEGLLVRVLDWDNIAGDPEARDFLFRQSRLSEMPSEAEQLLLHKC
ncbi:MAG TPA: hypothetical protein PKC65_06065 [Pyrinomonadaceae bacterium]|nr:hypothetical protein [Pyrinomonadaceae bacterium]